MKQLFLIFAATTGYARPLAVLVTIMFITLLAILGFWAWADYHEIYLRNEIIATQFVCDAIDPTNKERLLAEKEKLARVKAEYNTFMETAIVRLFISERK